MKALAKEQHIFGEDTVASKEDFVVPSPRLERTTALALLVREGSVDLIEAADRDFRRLDDAGGPAASIENEAPLTQDGFRFKTHMAAGGGLSPAQDQCEQFIGEFGIVAKGPAGQIPIGFG